MLLQLCTAMDFSVRIDFTSTHCPYGLRAEARLEDHVGFSGQIMGKHSTTVGAIWDFK